jgi:hypothetical protein
MNKVKLPRHICEALEKVLEERGPEASEFILWVIPDEAWCRVRGVHWLDLHFFSVEPGNFFRLIDALRHGYEVEPEPITVTITPEMQEKITQYYANLDPNTQEDAFDREFVLGERSGVRVTLEMLGITIPGIPSEG